MAGIQKIGNVFYHVTNMEAAIAFYRDTLGMQLKFRDGDNWAAFDVAGATLALASGAGAGGPGGATVSLRVDDLDAFVAAIKAQGARVGDIHTGAHECTAELADPAGNRLVLYAPLPAQPSHQG